MQHRVSDATEFDTGDRQSHSPDRVRFHGPIVPLSPTAPTTTTSTSSMAYSAPFPFQQTSSPTVSPQPPLTRTQRTDEARTAFTAALRSAGAILDTELQARARDLHANAEALERQNQDLREQAEAFSEENDLLERQIREQRQCLVDLSIQTRSEAAEADRGIQEASYPSAEGEIGVNNADDVGAFKITGLGDVSDLDQFLKGFEQELSVLEETCRIVEEEEDFQEGQEAIDDVPYDTQQTRNLGGPEHINELTLEEDRGEDEPTHEAVLKGQQGEPSEHRLDAPMVDVESNLKAHEELSTAPSQIMEGQVMSEHREAEELPSQDQGLSAVNDLAPQSQTTTATI